ncbi:MAG: acyltransferase family protein [Pyrinomonadaceae bacterium]
MDKPLQKRIIQLDLLRTIAVLLVIGSHMTICPPETNLFFNKFTAIWNRGGWVGVDLFFVLSGFLISGLLFREYQKTNDLDIKRFLIRRGFKIYPAFWFLLIVTCAAAVFFKTNFYRLGLLGELFFVQNYAPNLWEHTWSLAVEEHFYIALCILFLGLLRYRKSVAENPFRLIPKIFALVAVACLAMRLLTVLLLPFQYARNVEPTHLRMDSLLFGVLISYLWHFHEFSENAFLRRYKNWIGIAGIILLLPAFLFDLNLNAWIAVIGFPLFYMGGGCLLIFALKSDFSKIPLTGFAAYLGTYSYSIYLWNIPLQNWFCKAIINLTGNDNWYFYAAVYFFGTFIVGIGTAKLVEYPFLKIRNRYFPTHGAASPVQSVGANEKMQIIGV